MPVQTEEERLAELQLQRSQLDQKIKDQTAKVAEKRRKERARRSIIIGDVVQDHADPNLIKMVYELVRGKVTNPKDLALFDIDA